jgi:hypothetical protein
MAGPSSSPRSSSLAIGMGVVVTVWYGAAVTAAVGVMVLHYHYHYHWYRNRRRDVDDDDDIDIGTDEDDFEWNDNKIAAVSMPSTSPFPWEPKKSTKPMVSTRYSFREPQANQSIKTTTMTTDHQLDILASMTFANGGLRVPTCPCCK